MEDLQAKIAVFKTAIGGYKAVKAYMDKQISGALGLIADLKQQIADSEVTYSIGDRFNTVTGKTILIRIGTDKYAIVSLSTGNYHYGMFEEPKLYDYITPDELRAICGGKITRYWDNRKQQKVSE